MPETRDNRYTKTKLEVDFSSGANPVGVEVDVCKSCGSVVVDRKIHNTWHKSQGK